MSDLISRCELFNKLAPVQTLGEAYGIIQEMPTVDAVPVRRGRWIPVYSSDAFGGDEATWSAHGDPIAYYYCSECKQQARAGEDGESLLTDYCPDCGARMDGKGNGNETD